MSLVDERTTAVICSDCPDPVNVGLCTTGGLAGTVTVIGVMFAGVISCPP